MRDCEELGWAEIKRRVGLETSPQTWGPFTRRRGHALPSSRGSHWHCQPPSLLSLGGKDWLLKNWFTGRVSNLGGGVHLSGGEKSPLRTKVRVVVGRGQGVRAGCAIGVYCIKDGVRFQGFLGVERSSDNIVVCDSPHRWRSPFIWRLGQADGWSSGSALSLWRKKRPSGALPIWVPTGIVTLREHGFPSSVGAHKHFSTMNLYSN